MTPQEELADYMATGMKDYAVGLRIFKNLAVDSDSNIFLSTTTPGKIHINMLRNKLLYHARVYDIKPQLYIKPTSTASRSVGGGKAAKMNISEPEKATGGTRVIVDANPVVRFEELPALFQEKYRTAGELSNQNKTLHAELKLLIHDDSKKEKRSELTNQMLENKKAIRSCWDAIDEWWKENKDKTVEQRLVDQAGKDAIDKQKRIKANKTYIQRNYGTGKKPEELQNRMDELTAWGIDYTEDIEKANQHSAEA